LGDFAAEFAALEFLNNLYIRTCTGLETKKLAENFESEEFKLQTLDG